MNEAPKETENKMQLENQSEPIKIEEGVEVNKNENINEG